MPSQTAEYQQYVCPEEFQDRINEVGGFNRYDEPNFLIVWGQGGGENSMYRAGGYWDPEGLPSYHGYRDLLMGGGTPCWCLLQWQDAVTYGTPEQYYVQNHDEDSEMQVLGEYPYRGRYRLLYSLRWVERQGNKLQIEAMPLNAFLLETVIPIIMAAKDISWEKTKAALADQKEREDKADVAMIEDVMRSNALPFGGNPVSYGKQGCRTAIIDKKIETMQRSWNLLQARAAKLNTGRGLMQF
jgi:hypothetical protein